VTSEQQPRKGTTLIKIDGVTYRQKDISNVSALVILKASEELPTLGLTITWDELVSLLKRTVLTQSEAAYTATEQLWINVLMVWMTLNACGVECSLYDAMCKTDVELIQGPEDHKPGKARAPQTRQGSGRGGANRAGKAPRKTRSSTSS
jgi:hypothetical protein